MKLVSFKGLGKAITKITSQCYDEETKELLQDYAEDKETASGATAVVTLQSDKSGKLCTGIVTYTCEPFSPTKEGFDNAIQECNDRLRCLDSSIELESDPLMKASYLASRYSQLKTIKILEKSREKFGV